MIKTEKEALLRALYQEHTNITESPLYIKGSTTIVFGEGNADAQIVLLGEAPGKQEDIEGRPFVGRSGKLLNQMLELAGLNRTEVYITNIVKCRPPNNRTPLPQELQTGLECILIKQLEIIQPKIICTLGATALQGLTGQSYQITKIRGQFITFNKFLILPTFHPAYILRNRNKIELFLSDIQKLTNLPKKPRKIHVDNYVDNGG